MVTVLRTGSHKFRQVWRSQNTCEALFFLNGESHAVQIRPTPEPACSFLTVPRSKLYNFRSGRNSALIRFNWHKVWTGVKCNFSWEHFQKRYFIRKLSPSRVRMWNFTINNFTSIQRHNLYTIGKLSIRWVKVCNFTRIGDRSIRTFESAKNDCATSIHGDCIVDRFGQVRTGLDKSEHVWSAIFPPPWVARCPNFAHSPNLRAVF